MGPTYGVAPLPEGEGGVYMADAIPAPPEGERVANHPLRLPAINS
jgi:hypothetical protein